MVCPYCGAETPGEMFCSVSCMKKSKAKKEQNIDENEQIKELYDLLPDLTNNYIFCAFHKQKLVDGKPQPVEKEDFQESYELEKKKFCPRCYRTYGISYLPKNLELVEEETDEDRDKWKFILSDFTDLKEILLELNHYIDKDRINDLNEPKQPLFRPKPRPRGRYTGARKSSRPYKGKNRSSKKKKGYRYDRRKKN